MQVGSGKTLCQSHSTLRLPTYYECLLALSNPCWTLPVGCSLVHRGQIESTITGGRGWFTGAPSATFSPWVMGAAMVTKPHGSWGCTTMYGPHDSWGCTTLYNDPPSPWVMGLYNCQEHGIFRTFSLLLCTTFYVVLPPPHVLFSQFHSSKKRQRHVLLIS